MKNEIFDSIEEADSTLRKINNLKVLWVFIIPILLLVIFILSCFCYVSALLLTMQLIFLMSIGMFYLLFINSRSTLLLIKERLEAGHYKEHVLTKKNEILERMNILGLDPFYFRDFFENDIKDFFIYYHCMRMTSVELPFILKPNHTDIWNEFDSMRDAIYSCLNDTDTILFHATNKKLASTKVNTDKVGVIVVEEISGMRKDMQNFYDKIKQMSENQ